MYSNQELIRTDYQEILLKKSLSFNRFWYSVIDFDQWILIIWWCNTWLFVKTFFKIVDEVFSNLKLMDIYIFIYLHTKFIEKDTDLFKKKDIK